MAYRGVKYLLFGLAPFLTACLSNVDFGGFITTNTRIDERYSQSMQWNQDHPIRNVAVGDSVYRLFVAADVHLGGTRNLDVLLQTVLEEKATAVMLPGDIVTGHQHAYDTLYTHLQQLNEIPYFMMAGNHDLYFGGWQWFKQYFGSSTYHFEIVHAAYKDLVICLDTGTGTLGKDQLKWLQERLKTRGNYRRCMVFTHNNFIRSRNTTSTNPNMDELYILFDWFLDYKVDLVVMGHDHKHSVEKLGPTTYLTMDALRDGFKGASFLVLELSENTLTWKFQNP